MHKFLTYLLLGLFVSGCSVYKIDVRQGNLVTQEMLEQLELGMEQEKVRFIMGTPLVVDVFHQNRWDYLYSYQASADDQREQRHISLYFDENQRLVRVDGDVKIGQPRQQKPTPFPEFDQEPIL
jgi:outer membrane protein assembly factor BamE